MYVCMYVYTVCTCILDDKTVETSSEQSKMKKKAKKSK